MRRKRPVPIFLSVHAIERWRERIGDHSIHNIQRKIRLAIWSALKTGIEVDSDGLSTINVDVGIKAVIAPDIQGGWRIVTVLSFIDKKEVHLA